MLRQPVLYAGTPPFLGFLGVHTSHAVPAPLLSEQVLMTQHGTLHAFQTVPSWRVVSSQWRCVCSACHDRLLELRHAASLEQMLTCQS